MDLHKSHTEGKSKTIVLVKFQRALPKLKSTFIALTVNNSSLFVIKLQIIS